YYRLRQVNDDGSSDYSEVRVIQLQSNEQTAPVYTVFPNPATDFIVLSSSESSDQDAIVNIQSVYGVTVFSTVVPGSSLREKIMLPSSLPRGYYFVSVKNASLPASFFKIFINR
ncbi:MAG: T9SS type A sorting domain-containing protein, partial [Chitinophagales bacterium]